MIIGFFDTFQHDIKLVVEKVSGKVTDPEQDQKVFGAVIRLFATLGMCKGILNVAKAIPIFAANRSGALFNLAMGVAIYVVSHDAFIAARNKCGRIIGKKYAFNPGPLTRGTMCRPLWDFLLSRAQA